ncbi:MAG: diguanylate cyclase, partial [Candidatus Omnitrophica bacterium]|nr:diguanylate cyclase [Candidatus Omnitrophota bacterium]
MFSPILVLSVICIYSALLFIIALWVEKSPNVGKKLSNSPLVYALSLGIYCTAWTYYGSVGKAASSGFLFLTIYLGPTLAVIFWWTMLRKLVRIKNTYRITSIADFISARYNNSHALAAIATLLALLGGIPYISLQLKAVFSTFQLITCYKATGCSFLSDLFVRIIVLGIMIIFTILMGVRRLDPTERHPGMMVALAVECIVKCLAFIAAGIFVTYFIFHGFKDIFRHISLNPEILNPPSGGTEKVTYSTWVSYLLLSMSAIMFLPRQFHVAVVENPKEKNIVTAMWFFPIYMILLNVFVYPIALGGLLKAHTIQQADTFVLLMPLENAKPWLTLFVFIGGFSAAIGMIMIATMTIATMVTNHLFLPLTQAIKSLNFLRRHLLKCRWLVVGACVLLGYWFEVKIGESYMLVNIGMISFAAVFQFAPSIIGGLFWKKGNRRGALLGLSSGFLIWVYTLLIPSFVRRGWLPSGLLEDGPFHIRFLNLEHLFGVTNLDYLSHAVFWSILFNAGLYILGSLYFKQEDEERIRAENFIDILKTSPAAVNYGQKIAHIDVKEKKEIVVDLLMQYFPEQEAIYLTEKLFADMEDMNDGKISVIELAELNGRVEKFLTGSIGAAAAHRALKQAGIFLPLEAKELQ